MRYQSVRTTVAALAVAGLSAAPAMAGSITLESLGVFETGVFDDSAAEIVAYDAATMRLFSVNADAGQVDVLDLSDPTNPTKINTITAAGEINSVSVLNGKVAIAVESPVSTQSPGSAVFYDAASDFTSPLATVGTGALPDMITFTPDGRYALVANEAEPNDDYTVDPEGSVTVIDTQSGYTAQTAGFTALTAGDIGDTRVFGPGASIAQDLEPEYIAVSKDSTKAFVVLQENNAIAVVDIASATITDVVSLGFKDHSLPGNELDVSNRDGAINITNQPIYGMFQPDAISVFEKDGVTYIVTANEGDSRDYDGFSEEDRVKDLVLDPTAFPNAAELQQDENLGRLKITNTLGDTDGDGDFDELYAYGARSFSLFKVVENAGKTELELVFDSGAQFEEITASLIPDGFNSTNDENDSFDDRSDDKGPEPEALTIGTVKGRTYAFLGLERVGGIMIYDITDPLNPFFVEYTTERNFDPAFDVELDATTIDGISSDLGPEGFVFINAEDSPTGLDLLVVANEVSGSVRVYGVNYVPSPSAAAAGMLGLAGLMLRRRSQKRA